MGQGLLTGKVMSADEVQPGRQRSRLFSNRRPQQRHGEPGAQALHNQIIGVLDVAETALLRGVLAIPPGLEDETFAAIRKMAWISKQIGEPMANVSLSWAREMPGITSLLMGARNQSQLERNLASLVRHCKPNLKP